MATAILHMVSIWLLAVPYLSHIHKFEYPRRYGMVVATAVWVKTSDVHGPAPGHGLGQAGPD